MEKNNPGKEIYLFPKYFKVIGLVVMVLSFGIAFYLAKMTNREWLPSEKIMLRALTLNGFILGLALIAWSKDKVEDERTIALRLRMAAWAFTFGVAFVVMNPIITVINEEPLKNEPVQNVMMMMLVMYLVLYYSSKRKL